MVKAFCDKATFLLKAEDGTKMIVPPLGFVDIPEKFMGDQTFKMAVASGIIQLFETAKQGEKIERKARTTKKDEPKDEPKDETEKDDAK